jgi:hypothetical protein
MTRRTHPIETPPTTAAPPRASEGAPIRHDAVPSALQRDSAEPASDPAEAIDRTLQMLFSCCLMLCRASREADYDDELIHSAIARLDTSIRVLRGAATAVG